MADSLARKIAAMAKVCAHVPKTGFNSFHKYKYATAADVFEKVNEAMAALGVCATVDAEILSESVDSGNRTVTVKTILTLHDADSDQTFTTAGLGCGQDKGDKAVMKAQTASLKYAWMLCLNISTGDDPEADEDTDKRNHAPPRQQAETVRSGAAPVRTGTVPPAVATPPPTAQPAARRLVLADLWKRAEDGKAAIQKLDPRSAPMLPPDDAAEAELVQYVEDAKTIYLAVRERARKEQAT